MNILKEPNLARCFHWERPIGQSLKFFFCGRCPKLASENLKAFYAFFFHAISSTTATALRQKDQLFKWANSCTTHTVPACMAHLSTITHVPETTQHKTPQVSCHVLTVVQEHTRSICLASHYCLPVMQSCNSTGMSGSNLLENTEVFSIVSAAEDAWVNIYLALYKQKDEKAKVRLHLHPTCRIGRV